MLTRGFNSFKENLKNSNDSELIKYGFGLIQLSSLVLLLNTFIIITLFNFVDKKFIHIEFVQFIGHDNLYYLLVLPLIYVVFIEVRVFNLIHSYLKFKTIKGDN